MTSHVFLALGLIGSTVALTAACSDSQPLPPGAQDGGGDTPAPPDSRPNPDVAVMPDGGPAPDGGATPDGRPTGDAASLWPEDATKLFAWQRGGFGPQPQPGSDCSPLTDGNRYTLTVAGRQLEWQVCEHVGATLLHMRRQGMRALTLAEHARIDAAMRQLEIVTSGPCGADKAMLTVTVTTPAGEQEYRDAFYVCTDRTKTFVSGIDAVFTVLRELAM